MATPFNADATGYAWLESDEGPGGWMSQASCFTFLRPAEPRSILNKAAFDELRELDFTGVEDAADKIVSEQELDTAVFDGGDGWTVVYQDNCFPGQFADALLASNTIKQGIVVFWNVNSVTEFSLWENGTQVVTFQDAYERDGSEPDRLNSAMQALGIPLDEPTDSDVEGDDWFATDAQLMALAETITGVHLNADFLARPLYVGRLR